jgi:hypothetical protein
MIRQQLAKAEQKDIPPFLPERPIEMDYVHQAILELLERLYHSFKIIEVDLRKHLTEMISTLSEDGKLRSADCWYLDKSLGLLLILGKEDQAKALSMDQQAIWSCPWNTYGLTISDIAFHDGISLNLPIPLKITPSNV